MKLILYSFFLIAIVISGCSKFSRNEMSAPALFKAGAGGGAAFAQDISEQALTTPRKLIKNARINFEVKDLKQTSPLVQKLVKASGGYITSEAETGDRFGLQTNFSIRVPAQNFDTLVVKLLDLALHLKSKEITTDDVTEKFVDTETRLKTKKEVEKRYLEILKQAKSVSEILQVQQSLGSIREEIEAKEGQLKYLSDQVAFSTIALTIHENIEPTSESPSFWSRVSAAFQKGWNIIIDIFIEIISLWGVLLLIGAGGFLFLRWRKKRKPPQGSKP